jgi:hypothetical protein
MLQGFGRKLQPHRLGSTVRNGYICFQPNPSDKLGAPARQFPSTAAFPRAQRLHQAVLNAAML